MSRRVVVTGQGIVSPLGCSVDECFRRVCAGESGIHEVSLFDVSGFKVRVAGDIRNWNPPSESLDQKNMKRFDRFSQFAVVAAHEATQHSGIDFSKYNDRRCSVILGSGIGGLGTIEEQLTKLIAKGPDRVSPLTIPKIMLNAAGGNLAIRYGLKGPCYTVATACASATNAIGDAFNMIRSGAMDVVITGGAEAALTRMGLAAFQNMRALSSGFNDTPQKASRPFDKDRDGFVFAEGAGILIFEDLEKAQARGAKIFAEVIGFGTSCDAGHITQPDETGAGASEAMRLALTDANIQPTDVDYINAHGTSTPLGDIAETTAVKNTFGDHAKNVAISSTKSQLGHSLGASGGIELVLSIQAMLSGTVPPTINLDNPDPQCDLDYTANVAGSREMNCVMSNSFGFGGHNASVVVRRFDD